jgi:hypothetical protein
MDKNVSKGTIRIDWSSALLPDGTEEYDWSIKPEPPMADERLAALLTEIAERV